MKGECTDHASQLLARTSAKNFYVLRSGHIENRSSKQLERRLYDPHSSLNRACYAQFFYILKDICFRFIASQADIMCASLSPANFQLRNKILSEAAKHVCTTGFTTSALAAALRTIEDQKIDDRTLAHLFNRGFPIALVEHVVKSSNQAVQRELEFSFSKNAVVRSIEANFENFVQGRFMLPAESDVAEKALLTKIEFLKPLAVHWPSAVAHELCPSNLPYTIINSTEFVDITAYYMERISALNELLDPARRILQSKAMGSCVEFADTKDSSGVAASSFLTSFLHGIPLSSGPYAGHSSFNPSWFLKRGQLAVLYGTAAASLLGDVSRNAADTRALTKKAVKAFF